MASPSSPARPSPPPRTPLFTPILENEKGRGDGELAIKDEEETTASRPYKNQPTPLPSSKSTASKKLSSTFNGAAEGDGDDPSVSCTNCRPSAREKISIVPLDTNRLKHPSSLSPSPAGLLRSLFLSITRRSPRSPSSAAAPSSSSAVSSAASSADEWRLTAEELSRKLVHATRKRDEALLESSRIKYSLSELERKLGRLESYCHDLQAALDRCSSPNPVPSPTGSAFPVEPFIRAVSDARAAVRHLSRSLTAQLRPDQVAVLLHPHSTGQWRRKPGGLLFYMEALLNRIFYAGFGEGEPDEAVDPAARCEANQAAYEAVRRIGWGEVLSKGTRFYSEGLSRFCDRKMSEVVGLLGWARAWPEALLEAFFGAAKGTWVVRLLARSVHPAVPVLRVDRGVRFDPRFMEDIAADRVTRLEPVSVKMMVAPGFHVYTSCCGLVKCKVLCVYSNSCNSYSNNGSKSACNNSFLQHNQEVKYGKV
ncbi:IRK-interacting protein-like [Phoenix dactylifera]|uniref:IRK-interacting protein-like n=1 Tax=Phoenix dactylifera TaxID=42345 RepID=A0A8B7BJU8_PHODC|nr:IRK-interacting protein-like [Phoenix dactylifera]